MDHANAPSGLRGQVARAVAGTVALLLVAGAGWTAWTHRLVSVSTPSMQPVVVAGDRFLVDTRDTSADVGDVVVVDAPDWLGSEGTRLVVKRVVATAGQRVVCCDAQFRVTVDGVPVPGGTGAPQVVGDDGTRRSGDAPFDVVVPDGRVFLMGDNRPVSVDSRAHTGTEGGTLPVSAVLGRPAFRLWPLSRFGPVDVQQQAAPTTS